MKLNLSKSKLLLLSSFFYDIDFWISVSVPYLYFRGIELQEILLILSIFQIANMIFEFPTGVIGDYFGHKISMMIGNVISCCALIVMMLNGPAYVYYTAIILRALGSAFYTGSDVALLKKVSTDFKKDYSTYKSRSDFIFVVISFLGTFLFKINPLLPMAITAVAPLISVFLLSKVQYTYNYRAEASANVFLHAADGIKSVLKNKILLLLLFSSMLLSGYAVSVKTVLGTIVELAHFDVAYTGAFIGLMLLFRGMGKKSAAKKDNSSIIKNFILLMCIFLAVSFTHNLNLSIVVIIVSSFLVGIINVQMGVVLNNHINEKYRASILSLENLLFRIVVAIYLTFVGGALITNGIIVFLLTTALVFLLALLLFITAENTLHKHKHKNEEVDLLQVR